MMVTALSGSTEDVPGLMTVTCMMTTEDSGVCANSDKQKRNRLARARLERNFISQTYYGREGLT
jgi:hypothetical protein